MKPSKLRGYIYLILATVIYGLFGIFYRQTSAFGPFSQVAVRYGILCAFILSLFLFKELTWQKIEQRDVKWFLIWVLPASIQPVLTFIAFVHLPVGLTYFLLYSTTILGGIVSGKVFFSEKFTLTKGLALFLILGGLFVIYRSDITLVHNIYVLVALCSGFIIGFWNTLTKKVSGKYQELQMIMLDGSSAVVVGTIGAIATKETLPSFSNSATWFWIVVFALFDIFSSLLLIRGFKEVEAQAGSLIMLMELIFSSVFGFLFLGELLKSSMYLGGFLILLAALLPALDTNINKNALSLRIQSKIYKKEANS